jgi:hypothetical protein
VDEMREKEKKFKKLERKFVRKSINKFDEVKKVEEKREEMKEI